MKCYGCSKEGHIARNCRQKNKVRRQQINVTVHGDRDGELYLGKWRQPFIVILCAGTSTVEWKILPNFETDDELDNWFSKDWPEF